jgi:two-component system chemotaxis sensor kinase CheA
VTTLANGQIVLILDMKELLGAAGDHRGVTRRTLIRDEDKPKTLAA